MMELKRYTVDDVMAWEPCYDREQVQALFGKRETLTIVDALKMKRLPASDKIWLATREGVLPDKLLHEFACWCAEQALLREREAGREPDARSWAAVEAKRKWLNGEIDDEQRAGAWAAAAWAVAEAARAARAAARVAPEARAAPEALAAARAAVNRVRSATPARRCTRARPAT